MEKVKLLSLMTILMPLGAALFSGFFGRWLGKLGVQVLTIASVSSAFAFSAFTAYLIYFDGSLVQNFNLYHWSKIGTLSFNIGFLIDELSILMMVVVSFVSLMVHIYTVGYMRDDPGNIRFFSYISLFTFGMLMLVSSNNFLQLFFGWEMVGLMSYLLIGFWYQKESAIFANLKAFLVNRVGDFGFILGIAGILYYFGTLDYAVVFERAGMVNANAEPFKLCTNWTFPALSAICLSLFIGAMGKSAQVPLHVWLPDSMEGPTPISALIHAATMVTAGVFMIARLSPIFEYSKEVLNFILAIGTLTCFLMGLVGLVENDIKRIIAYSTLSQLGYMMVAMGVSAYPIGIFHLTTHAFFKALLFLGAGSIILALHHEQNIWNMGNLWKKMPITYITMLLGSLALIGFPFFSGFYSKDLILEAVKNSPTFFAGIAYPIVLGGVFITALYTFRLFFVVFHKKNNNAAGQHNALSQNRNSSSHESPIESPVIWIPLVLLAIPSVVAGFLMLDPLFSDYFKNAITIHDNHATFKLLQHENQGPFLMAIAGIKELPFWFAMAGIFVAWLLYIKCPLLPNKLVKHGQMFYQILKHQYGFNAINQRFIVPTIKTMGRICAEMGEKWLIDGIAVNGTAKLIGRLSNRVKNLQSGYLYHYAFMMIIGFLFLLVWLVLSEKG